MRGKLLPFAPTQTHTRIIPAHAGQTVEATSPVRAAADHPRACGANPVDKSVTSTVCGSSPRMRGKPVGRPAVRVRGRIIPAHAGQTSNMSSRHSCSTDHPRACGANVIDTRVELSISGSSPRMRGKQKVYDHEKDIPRIIPAHAGQTLPTRGRFKSGPDHPRACGANPLTVCEPAFVSGSSPRMRGKPWCWHRFRSFSRIIPAHAGQTGISCIPPSTITDHPRACGANTHRGTIPRTFRGSSPRMRGKPGCGGSIWLQRRIIPAHAGQT